MDFLFSDDAARGLYNSSTVMYTAAQLAAYMGFSEIILIGVDHHFRFSQNNQGEIVVDESAKDYFSEKYNEDKANLYIPNTEKSTLTYMAMKNHADLGKVRADLARKSDVLLMNEWREHRHIHENYNAITGEGCDSLSSDKFYHWGALLGVISMVENGMIPGFAKPLE